MFHHDHSISSTVVGSTGRRDRVNCARNIQNPEQLADLQGGSGGGGMGSGGGSGGGIAGGSGGGSGGGGGDACTVFVGNLAWGTTDEDLLSTFQVGPSGR